MDFGNNCAMRLPAVSTILRLSLSRFAAGTHPAARGEPGAPPAAVAERPCPSSGGKRCRIVKDRIRLWKAGIRDLVMELCCALHNFRVRLHPWQPIVESG